MSDLQLERVDDRLVLRDRLDQKAKPLAVDFLTPALRHRIHRGFSQKEPFARALGLKGSSKPVVFDATAGLGIDAFILAAYGCRVRAVERSETAYLLLEDGWRRLSESGLYEISARLTFERGDSIQILSGLGDDRPDVVYVDPMYPPEGRSKSALPKKGMQIFRRLIGADLDFSELIVAAREVARDRVVVKRPLNADIVPGVRHSYEGKTARYDVF